MKLRDLIYMIFVVQLTIIVSAQATECPVDFDSALITANGICLGTGRNQVCYGNNDVNLMSYDEASIDFNAPGDLADINKIRTLSLSALDVESGQWGIAIMRLLANLDPSQSEDVTVVLYGDVEIEDASNNPAVQIVTATTYSNLRRLPNSSTPVMDSVAPDDIVHITGRLQDNSWVRVVNPQTNIVGWMASSLLNNIDFDTLDIVDAREPYFAPMQAFYFQSGADSVDCADVPRDGIIVQTPEGLRRVTLWVNEVTIDFLPGIGATASIQTEADGAMSINVLEGSVFVGSDTEGYLAVAGSSVKVHQSHDDTPVSITMPIPTSADVINRNPINILDREIELPQSATVAEIAIVNDFADEPLTTVDEPLTIDDNVDSDIVTDSSSNSNSNVTSDNECSGNSCNAPGKNKDDCPGNSCNAPGKNKDKNKKNK